MKKQSEVPFLLKLALAVAEGRERRRAGFRGSMREFSIGENLTPALSSTPWRRGRRMTVVSSCARRPLYRGKWGGPPAMNRRWNSGGRNQHKIGWNYGNFSAVQRERSCNDSPSPISRRSEKANDKICRSKTDCSSFVERPSAASNRPPLRHLRNLRFFEPL